MNYKPPPLTEEQQKLADEFKAELIALLEKYDARIKLVADSSFYPQYDIEVDFKWQYEPDGIATRYGFSFQPGNFIP